MFVNRLFQYYRSYTDGYLPFPGAITDQPNMLVECLQEISIVKGILDAEDNDKAQEDNGGGAEGDGFKSVIPKR